MSNNESIETPEVSDEAIKSFIEGGDLPTFHPVLRVWREVLKPAAGERENRVTPAWANRVVASFQGLRFEDMNLFRDSYFDKILQLADILDIEIATDDECLTYSTTEEDAEHNSHHYKNLLLTWQLSILKWELDWDTTAPDAAVELAAISEVHKMFFGQTGLVGYLDNIKFQFDEADQQQLAGALDDLKEGR